MLKRILSIFFTLLIAVTTHAQTTDSLAAAAADSSANAPRKNIIRRAIDYFANTNKHRPDKKLDVSLIGGPHYSSDSKFGLGLVGLGTYNLDRTDTAGLRPSIAALYADATTAGHFKVGVQGINIWPGDRLRLSYDVSFQSVETKYWGIGYTQCSDDDNESKYRYLAVLANVSLTRRVARNLYVGPLVVVDYIDGRSFKPATLWQGLPSHNFSWGPGFTAVYDSRDCMTDAHRGVYLKLDQWFNIRALGNDAGYSVNEFTGSSFNNLWRGAILASMLHWRLTWGDTPWCDMSTIGGRCNMRGYFEGRYRDKNVIDVCVELRQHVWRRSGVALWVGAASLFPRFSDIRIDRVLPNYGFGYRWEFKRRINLRLDLGFGRHQTGFIFSINEAF